jgi:hypothetical protein
LSEPTPDPPPAPPAHQPPDAHRDVEQSPPRGFTVVDKDATRC